MLQYYNWLHCPSIFREKIKKGRPVKTAIGATAAVVIMLAIAGTARAGGSKIEVLAAENFYGDIARQIGGDRVSVTSVLGNPDQDPHLFEISPAVVRQIATAQVVILNGANYDPWMDTLLKVTSAPGRVVVVVAALVDRKAGDNPHLWYDPATMHAVGPAVASALAAVDPAHGGEYGVRLKTFAASLEPIDEKIAAMRGKYADLPVAATEPVFGYMAAALKLNVHNARFQLAVMNNTEPSARDLAAFEQDLRMHRVRAMFYNKQATDKLVQHLVDLARASKIPVVGVTETCPPGLSFQSWMLDQLDAVEKALAGPSS